MRRKFSRAVKPVLIGDINPHSLVLYWRAGFVKEGANGPSG